MNVNTVMDAIGTRLGTVTGLRVYDYPADKPEPPAVLIDLPTVEFDYAKGRGLDRAVFPVAVIVGRNSDRAARDKVAVYLSGDSLKAAIDGTLGGTVEVARLMDVRPDRLTVGTIVYVGAVFNVEVID